MLGLAMAQDAPRAGVETTPGGSQRWSILADPCAGRPLRPDEVLVCGQRDGSQSARLPLPAERGPPDRPMPGNPDISGAGALALTNAPCATRSGGCTTGIDLLGGGTMLIRGIGKLIDPDSCCETPGEGRDPVALVSDIGGAVKRNLAKKPDKSKRVAIPLDDPVVVAAPRVP
ncbi:hypothetical protein [Sphingomonas xinjiangensis]|uniref:Uncharacterized protein n=1 Tax=Sphingomonas xinjiangensis TaxID=643568 RepID=A0A840YFX8_9SPHN|nr:hypothetical protein [Sphingomonas xinjiangensis]MBB5711734.1 hypothetical protein [Sphingomonas xinjiangensis]